MERSITHETSDWRFRVKISHCFCHFTLKSVDLTGNNCERRFLVVSFSFKAGSHAERLRSGSWKCRAECISVIAWPLTCLSSDDFHFQERSFFALKKAVLFLFFDLFPRKIHENNRRKILAFDKKNQLEKFVVGVVFKTWTKHTFFFEKLQDFNNSKNKTRTFLCSWHKKKRNVPPKKNLRHFRWF